MFKKLLLSTVLLLPSTLIKAETPQSFPGVEKTSGPKFKIVKCNLKHIKIKHCESQLNAIMATENIMKIFVTSAGDNHIVYTIVHK